MNYRTTPQYSMGFDELLVDNFAGGGGASTGIEQAIGRPVDIAINHDEQAISMHTVNHPTTKHYCESVWDVDPREVCKGRPVGLAWFSPDCRHFSKAKGGAPVSPRVRGLAWVVLRWAATVKPRVIMLENVEEFTTWGPLVRDDNGDMRPCPKRKGQTFSSFTNALKRQGYQVEYKQLRACDYGAPTIRKRLFMIARCDGQPIIWPAPTHGPGLKPYRTAADIIDWSLPCPSIFGRKKPLAENTLRRIAKGIQRFIIDNPKPFIIKTNHAYEYFRGQEISEPLQTITARGNGFAIVTPYLTEHANGSGQRVFSAAEPLRTQVSSVKGGHFALCSAFLAKHYSGVTGHGVEQPIGTITQQDHHSLVTSHMMKLRGSNTGSPTDSPLHTISAGGTHHAEVRAFLLKYYGTNIGHDLREPLQTVTSKHRFGLVTVRGEEYQIVDIGMRMLQPHELYAAQGFPADYIFDRDANGKPITKTQQIAKCGNSVCPPLAAALVRANMIDHQVREVAA